MSRLPMVAIVGRANVGKSCLFNVLVGSRRAIVADEPGTTRDTVYAHVEDNGLYFLLADTAGLKISPADDFETNIQRQITEATETADCILVVVEASTTITEEDRRVIKTALKSKKPTLLVTNKIDQAQKQDIEHWQKTGIKSIVATSCTQRTGIRELLDFVSDAIGNIKTPQPQQSDIVISLIGRPNVGKSSLYNSLAKKQQALVSPQAGTTRDSNRFTLRYHGQSIDFIDTAGIRRPGRIKQGVEQFSVLRAISAIDEADLCLLLVDVNEPATHLEQKLAGMIQNAGKGLIMVITKWDTADKNEKLADNLRIRFVSEFAHVWWAPLIFTSAITGQNLPKLFELITIVDKSRRQKIQTAKLNYTLREVVEYHPPAGVRGHHPKLRYITQTDSEPPTFTMYGSKTDFLHWSYKRYLEKALRSEFDFTGSPIRLYFSDRESTNT